MILTFQFGDIREIKYFPITATFYVEPLNSETIH